MLSQQGALDENQLLRRRLEAIERTALKLNLPGPKGEIEAPTERLDLECSEVLRLKDTIVTLKADKFKVTEVYFSPLSVAILPINCCRHIAGGDRVQLHNAKKIQPVQKPKENAH